MNDVKVNVTQYCPYCKRDIEASNVDEVESGEHDGFIFVHDNDVIHDDEYDFTDLH